MFLGKSDNRVNPSPSDGGNNTIGERSYGSSKRPAAPATVGGGKSSAKSQKISKSVKAVQNFFKHPINERNMVVVRDIGQTTTEIWLTFIFTVLVGSFFLGGGIYLVWLGKKNNVVDFAVVGGMGTLIGFCLICVGMFLFCKPLCLAHRRRKQERFQEKQQAMTEAEYVSRAKAKLLTLQIADTFANRRPSHVELYGQQMEGSPPKGRNPGSRIQSASSGSTLYDPPPPIALPDKTKDGDGPGRRSSPVILMRETTADDRLAITNALEKKDLVKQAMLRAHEQSENPLSSETNGISSEPAIEPAIDTTDLRPIPEKAVSDKFGHHSDEVTLANRRREQGSSADLLEELLMLPETKDLNSIQDGLHAPRIPQSSDNSETAVAVNVDKVENARISAKRRRSVLSAANERQKSVSPETERGDEDDTIVVIPH